MIPEVAQSAEAAKAEKESRQFLTCCFAFLIVLGVLIGLVVYSTHQIDIDWGRDDIIAEVASPDGAYVAVVVARGNGTFAPSEGGADRVVLRRASEKLAFDRDLHINVKPMYEDGLSYGVSVKWKGKRTLIVDVIGCYKGDTDRDVSETAWNDVKVKFHNCHYGR